MIKNTLQPVIRQVYCIDRMCCLQKCLRVVSILHDRLPKLLVITCQTVFFVRLVLISVLESLKSQDKMMQPSILCPVEIQNRHSATVHIFAVLEAQIPRNLLSDAHSGIRSEAEGGDLSCSPL